MWRSLLPLARRTDGCWFWAARGSGIALNLGRTRAFRNRAEAARAGFGTHVLTNRSGGKLELSHARLDTGVDLSYAVRAAREGYDSVQVLHGNGLLFGDSGATSPAFEVIVSSHECVRSPQGLSGPCAATSRLRRARITPPSSGAADAVGERDGDVASRVVSAAGMCACRNEGSFVLNCGRRTREAAETGRGAGRPDGTRYGVTR